MRSILWFIFITVTSVGALFSCDASHSFPNSSQVHSHSSVTNNNAYIYFERFDGNPMMCLIYEGHYFVCQLPEHYEKCPCEH